MNTHSIWNIFDTQISLRVYEVAWSEAFELLKSWVIQNLRLRTGMFNKACKSFSYIGSAVAVKGRSYNQHSGSFDN